MSSWTADNAVNMKIAIAGMEILRLPCIGHPSQCSEKIISYDDREKRASRRQLEQIQVDFSLYVHTGSSGGNTVVCCEVS